MNPFLLAVPNAVGTTSAALDLLVVDINSALSLQLSAGAAGDEVAVYQSNRAAVADITVEGQLVANLPANSDGDGRTPVEAGGTRCRYLYVKRIAHVTDGLNLIVEAQSSTSGVPGSTAWIQGGNSFGATGVLGTNDAFDLQIRADGVTRATITSAGAITLAAAAGQNFAATGGLNATLAATTGSVTITSGVDIIGNAANSVALTAAAGNASLIATAGTASLDSGVGGQVHVGTAAVDHATTVGSTAGLSLLTLRGGTSGVTMTTAGGGDVNIDTGGAANLRVGAGAVVQTVIVGSVTGASQTNIQGGTNGIIIGNAVAQPVTIGSITGAASTSLRAGTGVLTLVRNGVTWTWPNADGVAGAVGGGSALVSNGAGGLTFLQVQSGSSAIGATGVSAAIAANITAGSRIFITVKDFVASTAVGLEAKAAGRTVGAPGSFVVTAYDAAGAAVAGANGTTFDWFVFG